MIAASNIGRRGLNSHGTHRREESRSRITRRSCLQAMAGGLGLSLPAFYRLQAAAADAERPPGENAPRAKSCIIVFCWGGISHIDTWDLKPNAPSEIRGEFNPISTSVSGIQVAEHLPLIAEQMHHLAVVRSIHHDDSAHGRGMYWNLTGHRPPRAGNIPPMQDDWPSLPAMVAKIRPTQSGVPAAVRIPYPMVDNGTLQAGEYGGWLGAKYDPVVIRPDRGEPFGGVSRTLGSQVLDFKEVDTDRVSARTELLASLGRPISHHSDFEGYDHFTGLARDMLLGSSVRDAYDLDREDPVVRDMYGQHLGGQSMLLARRLTEAGVPIVQVCCAAGDLNGGQGDMWDTHGDNFNRLRNRLLPVYDQGVSALIKDLEQRGTLDETLICLLTEFGRTPRINGNAGRDHFPNVYSVAFAGGGMTGGQVYGASDHHAAEPKELACGPADVHATIFDALGISPRTELHDQLGRPFAVSDGQVLPLS